MPRKTKMEELDGELNKFVKTDHNNKSKIRVSVLF